MLIWSINDKKIINSCRFSDAEIEDVNFNNNGSLIAISLSDKMNYLHKRTDIIETKTLKLVQTINDTGEKTNFSYCGNFILLYDDLYVKRYGRIYDLNSGIKIDEVEYSEFSKCGNFLVNRNDTWRLLGNYNKRLNYRNYLLLENLINIVKCK